ncbi:hypothetical protein GGX14DRAFT_601810 [Mycena pura]|uniref:Uncharacterized protein n=1 Tax=Mycena pura TaxID=153505 RepID=A0AAD6VLV3_9AGAR|nr:hypothetical protein GGX14DRAFT_601810 [Mycena pura]
MLPNSQSESSGLKNGKRKRVSNDVQDIIGKILAVARRELPLSDIDDDEWETIAKNVSSDAELFPDGVQVPFTGALPFFGDLCGPIEHLDICEDMKQATGDGASVYDEAAMSLQESPLWRGVREHVIMEIETSCRTAIDLVLLTAVNLAQRHICETPEIDDALRIRHSLVHPAPYDFRTASWVAIQQDVDIPGQSVRRGLAFNGIIDYLLTIVSTKRVAHARHAFLDASNVYGGLGAEERLFKIHDTLAAAIIEAKTKWSMKTKTTMAQVASQGAALCILAKRTAVINTLTNGVEWRFFRISKESDQVSPAPSDEHNAGPRQIASTARNPPDLRSSSLRSATKMKSAPLPTAEEAFNIATTRTLDIFVGRDLAIVLRLLTISILSKPEEFGELTSGVGLQKKKHILSTHRKPHRKRRPAVCWTNELLLSPLRMGVFECRIIVLGIKIADPGGNRIMSFQVP